MLDLPLDERESSSWARCSNNCTCLRLVGIVYLHDLFDLGLGWLFHLFGLGFQNLRAQIVVLQAHKGTVFALRGNQTALGC